MARNTPRSQGGRDAGIESSLTRNLAAQPPREREFSLPGFRIAALEWGEPGGLPVLAIHGWLDNAGSFDLLAPLLGGCHLVALDCAGHGRSGRRSADATYSILEDVGDVLEVAAQLGWSRFSVIGHSRGAAIGTLLAGSFPDRVERLVLIEGGVPITGTAEEAPDDLALALTERKALRDRTGRVYPTREDALRGRAAGFSPVSQSAAGILARRSLERVEGGFRWHSDRRLRARSELRLTAEHVEAFISRVRCPVLAIMAERSPFADFETFQRLLSKFKQMDTVTLPGGHHFHLEGAETEIALGTRAFLGLTDGG